MDVDLVKSDLERITGQRTIREGEAMPDVLARLDVLAKSPLTHQRLKHYLSKRSYVKALEWLEDTSIPHHA
jgi:hypothetical protein